MPSSSKRWRTARSSRDLSSRTACCASPSALPSASGRRSSAKKISSPGYGGLHRLEDASSIPGPRRETAPRRRRGGRRRPATFSGCGLAPMLGVAEVGAYADGGSWSMGLSACAPPLMMFIIGASRTLAPVSGCLRRQVHRRDCLATAGLTPGRWRGRTLLRLPSNVMARSMRTWCFRPAKRVEDFAVHRPCRRALPPSRSSCAGRGARLNAAILRPDVNPGQVRSAAW